MKTFNIKSSILSLVALFFVATMAHAQFDDIYYSASDDSHFVEVEEEYIAESRDDYGYSSFAEDDGYYYTSRIRRFSNPTTSIGYFSPIYTNTFNYGGYSPFGFNNVYRGSGVRVIGNNAFVNTGFGNRFITPSNRLGFGTSSFGRFGGGGFSNAYLCPPVGGFANTRTINTNSAVNSRNASTVSSTRRSGSTAGSTAGSTRTARTTRNFTTGNSSSNTVRRSTPRSSTRTSSSRSFSSPRSSSSRSSRSISSPRSSSSSRSSSVRSSSSRGARG